MSTRHDVPMDSADLVALAAGLYLEQCPESSKRIGIEGAGAFVDSDERTALMDDDKRKWTIIALSSPAVREKGDEFAALVRETVERAMKQDKETGESKRPWRD
ncbi:MAG: hypothetical protein GY832_26230 [Chloroflexi bacterium]|nr:hypothetical protein [Chloroflexota bacterium]